MLSLFVFFVYEYSFVDFQIFFIFLIQHIQKNGIKKIQYFSNHQSVSD